MDTTSQRKQIPVSEVADTLERAAAQLDRSRAADLGEMSQVLDAKFNALARDRERLAAKLGAGDPRVVALDRSLALQAQTAVGFRSEIASSLVAPPRVDANSWALHGNVLHTTREPAQGLTIALYQKDAWAEAIGHACTDKNGYFVLTVTEAARTDAAPLSLRALRSGNIILTDPRPVTIQPGHVEYREIVLGDMLEVCVPPDGKSDAPSPPPAKTQATKSVRHKGSSKK